VAYQLIEQNKRETEWGEKSQIELVSIQLDILVYHLR